jgi:hypothetical protein
MSNSSVDHVTFMSSNMLAMQGIDVKHGWCAIEVYRIGAREPEFIECENECRAADVIRQLRPIGLFVSVAPDEDHIALMRSLVDHATDDCAIGGESVH